MNILEPMGTDAKTADAQGGLNSPKQLEALIAAQPFFNGMGRRHYQTLAKAAMRATFEPCQWIFQKDDPANRFYVILEGRAVVETVDQESRVRRLQQVGPGEVLGWSWLFPPYYWHFDALALERTEAIFFYGTRLRAECEQDHDFGYEMMKRMSQVVIARLQMTRRQWIADKKAD